MFFSEKHCLQCTVNCRLGREGLYPVSIICLHVDGSITGGGGGGACKRHFAFFFPSVND